MLKSTATTAISTRELAWNTAGENLADEPMTGADMLKATGQDGWNVRKLAAPVGSFDPVTGQPVTFKGKHGIVRTGENGEPVGLGVAGGRFEVYQNEEMAEVMQLIADESGSNFVAGGYFGNGEKTFAVMKLESGLLIAGEDAADWYMGGTNAHDGNASLQLWTTMTRLKCVNMITPSMKSAKSRWKLRHTSSLRGKVAQARESLQLSWKWATELDEAAKRMLDAPYTTKEFERLVDEVEPPSDSNTEGWVTRQKAKRDAVVELFTEAETNGGAARGTRWGAYNALVEYYDWFYPVRGADDSGVKRAQRTIESPVQLARKQTAWDALYVPA